MRSSEDDGRGVAEESEDDGWRDFDIRANRETRRRVPRERVVLNLFPRTPEPGLWPSEAVAEWNVPPRGTGSAIPESVWELLDYRVFTDGARTSHTPFTSSNNLPLRTSEPEAEPSSPSLTLPSEPEAELSSPSLTLPSEPDADPIPSRFTFPSEPEADRLTSCPVCLEPYSDHRFPIVFGACGHSICTICEQRSRHLTTCAICRGSVLIVRYEGIHEVSWRKNYALIDVLNLRAREKEQTEEELRNKENLLQTVTNELTDLRIKESSPDCVECSKCETREKMGRMKICETCIGKGKEVNWEIIKEEKILPLCAFCSYCSGDHKGHLLREYLPWKLKNMVISAVLDGKSTVLSIDKECIHEIERGKELLKEWFANIDSFGDVDCESYEDAVSTVALLNEESSAVSNASENTLPSLRMFNKAVRQSIVRLNIMKKDVKKKKYEVN